MKRITKVRYKSGRVEIHEVETAGDTEDGSERTSEITHKCAEAPAPTFADALRALIPHVREIMEWPADFAEGRLEVSGVSYSMSKNEVEGAVISGFVRLSKTEGAWAWNTPHLPFGSYGDKPMPTLADEAVEAVEAVRGEARKYLGGERAEPGLFDKAESQPAANGEAEGSVQYV